MSDINPYQSPARETETIVRATPSTEILNNALNVPAKVHKWTAIAIMWPGLILFCFDPLFYIYGGKPLPSDGSWVIELHNWVRCFKFFYVFGVNLFLLSQLLLSYAIFLRRCRGFVVLLLLLNIILLIPFGPTSIWLLRVLRRPSVWNSFDRKTILPTTSSQPPTPLH